MTFRERKKNLHTTIKGNSMTSTKKELAVEVAKRTGCRKSMASKAVDSVFQVMRECLVKGQRIEIRGFGVFLVKDTKPKPAARNPRTGEVIFVPARRKAHFKPGKMLRESLYEPVEK